MLPGPISQSSPISESPRTDVFACNTVSRPITASASM